MPSSSSESDEKHHSHHHHHHHHKHHHKHKDKHKHHHKHSPRPHRRHSKSGSSRESSPERIPNDPVPGPQPNPDPLPPPPDPDYPSNGPHAGPDPESDGEKDAFNPELVAASLYKSMKGLGTDEKCIINELTSHTNDQLQLVKEKYFILYGKTLKEDLKSDLSFHFKDVCVGLLEPTREYEAHKLKNAIKGLGTDEMCVIDILCTKDGSELYKLNEVYKKLYNHDLESDLVNEETGLLGRLIRSLATGARSSSNDVDVELAEKEAQEIFDAGKDKLNTNAVDICRVLATQNFPQLRETFDAYKRISNLNLEDIIKSEVSGKLKSALIAIIQCSRNRPAYFARRLYKSMKGLGTNDDDLIRIIVSRSEIDMKQIREEYFKLYNEDLCERIKKDLSGDYKKIIVKLASK